MSSTRRSVSRLVSRSMKRTPSRWSSSCWKTRAGLHRACLPARARPPRRGPFHRPADQPRLAASHRRHGGRGEARGRGRRGGIGLTTFLRIVFAGTAEFAVPSLRALQSAGHEIQLVITQPDKPGHRMKVTPPPVKVAAHELGLEVYQPERIRDPEPVEKLRLLAPDVLVVVAYGQIVPPSVLMIPKHGAVNVHASLLPRHRGASPVAHAILVGDRETGVTIMRMDEQLDHGPILATRATVIGPDDDAPALTSRLADMGAELLVETCLLYT